MIHTVTIVIPETGFMIQLYQMNQQIYIRRKKKNKIIKNNERIATQ